MGHHGIEPGNGFHGLVFDFLETLGSPRAIRPSMRTSGVPRAECGSLAEGPACGLGIAGDVEFVRNTSGIPVRADQHANTRSPARRGLLSEPWTSETRRPMEIGLS